MMPSGISNSNRVRMKSVIIGLVRKARYSHGGELFQTQNLYI